MATSKVQSPRTLLYLAWSTIFWVSYGFLLGSCIGFSVGFSVCWLIGRLLPQLIGQLLVRFCEGFLLRCIGNLNQCCVLRWDGLLCSQMGWQCGSVALIAILQWQRDGKLFDNGERDCLQWQCYGELEAAWWYVVEGEPAMTTWRQNPWQWRERLPVMAILWQFQGGVASKILQWWCDSKLLDDGEAVCNGNAMAIWRRHGGVTLTTILQWQGDRKILNNEESDCLRWQC